MSRRIAVVGGGLAGIAAALACADDGAAVTLFEASPRLGGLASSFRRGALTVDNGQHVFLRCCTAYQDLLSRLGVAGQVCVQPRLDISVRSPRHARPARLRRTQLPAPLHLGGAMLRYHLLSPTERWRAVRAALALRHVDPADPLVDARSFGDWLTAQRQSPAAIAALWDLIGVATMNASAAEASLGLAATVFQLGLLRDAGAGDLGWARAPLGQLHAKAALAALDAAGARVHTGTKVLAVTTRGTGWLVNTSTGADQFDQVVLAVPPVIAERLAPPAAWTQSPGWSRALGSVPIVNVHLVLDRRVLDTPLLAGAHTPIQWVFDRTEPSGLREQPGSSDGQYLAVSLSAAHEWIDLPTAAVRARLLPDLNEILPELGRAQITDFFVTRERHATFHPAPGSAALRPMAGTALPGLAVAGAWTATGWPATMEGAVRSGLSAARLLLGRVASGPDAGRSGQQDHAIRVDLEGTHA